MSELAEELREHVFRALAAGPRLNARWVMNLEWFNELRKLDDSRGCLYQPGLAVSAPELLLGLPIQVRPDGGVPHLEPA